MCIFFYYYKLNILFGFIIILISIYLTKTFLHFPDYKISDMHYISVLIWFYSYKYILNN